MSDRRFNGVRLGSLLKVVGVMAFATGLTAQAGAQTVAHQPEDGAKPVKHVMVRVAGPQDRGLARVATAVALTLGSTALVATIGRAAVLTAAVGLGSAPVSSASWVTVVAVAPTMGKIAPEMSA